MVRRTKSTRPEGPIASPKLEVGALVVNIDGI